MISALILDFDGLMVDTETPAFQSWQQLYAENGHELTLDTWKDALGTHDGFDALAHLVLLVDKNQEPRTKNALGTTSARLAARRQELKTMLSASQPLLPGVLAILDQADAAGLPCAVASSSNREWVVGWLEHHSVAERFVCVCTSDDVAVTKPAPDLFLCAAQGLDKPPVECLVFEDSPNGISAAHAAGMPCVAVPGAISSQLELPSTELVIPTLDALPLAEIITQATTKV